MAKEDLATGFRPIPRHRALGLFRGAGEGTVGAPHGFSSSFLPRVLKEWRSALTGQGHTECGHFLMPSLLIES